MKRVDVPAGQAQDSENEITFLGGTVGKARVARPGEHLNVLMPDGKVRVVKVTDPATTKVGYVDRGRFRKG